MVNVAITSPLSILMWPYFLANADWLISPYPPLPPSKLPIRLSPSPFNNPLNILPAEPARRVAAALPPSANDEGGPTKSAETSDIVGNDKGISPPIIESNDNVPALAVEPPLLLGEGE